ACNIFLEKMLHLDFAPAHSLIANNIFNRGANNALAASSDASLQPANDSIGIAGGIDSSGMLAMVDSLVVNNEGYNGGGLANHEAAMVLTNTTVANNRSVGPSDSRGGGISNSGDLTLTNSLITKNNALVSGGGLFNTSDGTVHSNQTAIVKNTPQNCVGVSFACP
ncbi:MAG: hypothetical protein V4568_18500, partial [Pseudomonadota bacterium]